MIALFALGVLGCLHEKGHPSVSIGIELLEKAVKQKNEYACFILGNIYRIGSLFPKDLKKALAWYQQGADLNDAFNLVKVVYNRSQTGYNDGKLVGEIEPDDVLSSDNYKNAEAVLSLVLEERQRELAFEGKRWYDLVRKALRDGSTKSMLDILVPHKYESNGDAYKAKMSDINSLFFPIAEREINTNDLLEQNPVYEVEDLYEKN